MAELRIAEFLETLKTEIGEYQEKHTGKSAFMKLTGCELEVGITVSREGGGKFSLAVAEIGANVTAETVHKLRISMQVPEPAVTIVTKKSLDNDASSQPEFKLSIKDSLTNEQFVTPGGPYVGKTKPPMLRSDSNEKTANEPTDNSEQDEN